MKAVYELSDLRRWMDEEGETAPPIRLGVLGDPVAHSLSPAMQNAALENCGLDLRYAAFRIAPNELKEVLELLQQLDFVGVNLTVPHKIAALSWSTKWRSWHIESARSTQSLFAQENP